MEGTRQFLTREMLTTPEVRSVLKSKRRTNSCSSASDFGIDDHGFQELIKAKAKPKLKETVNCSKLVNSRLETMLVNQTLKAKRIQLQEMRAVMCMGMIPAPRRKPKRKLVQNEPTDYCEFIRRSTTAWRTMNFGANELKKDILKQRKEMERARSVLNKLHRRRTFSMPNLIAYGTVTTINSLLK